MFREPWEVTSPLTGYAGPLSWSNWNLELFVFVNGGKPENTEKNPRSIQDENQQQTKPSTVSTRTTFVEGESHHCSPDHVYKLLSGFNPYDLCYFIPCLEKVWKIWRPETPATDPFQFTNKLIDTNRVSISVSLPVYIKSNEHFTSQMFSQCYSTITTDYSFGKKCTLILNTQTTTRKRCTLLFKDKISLVRMIAM